MANKNDGPIVCGIDPGLSGGIAFISDAGFLRGVRMPLIVDKYSAAKKKIVDGTALYELLIDSAPSVIVVERVHAMPGQGVSSMFRFGQAFGQALALATVSAIEVVQVTPQTWKKHFGLKGSNKSDSLRVAADIFKTTGLLWGCKADNGIAEAALMARWYLDQMLKKV